MFGSKSDTRKFFISYDLEAIKDFPSYRNEDYKRIGEMLYKKGAQRILENVWFYKSLPSENAEDVKNWLLPLLKNRDGLVVIDAYNWDSHNLKEKISNI